MLLQLAERYRESCEYETAVQLIGMAVDNYPGHSTLIGFERDFDKDVEINWNDIMLPKPKVE